MGHLFLLCHRLLCIDPQPICHQRAPETSPPSGGVLLASNHISAYETIFLPWAVIRQHPMQMLWAPAKEELFEKPFQRLLYSSWGAFPVRRKRDVKANRTCSTTCSGIRR